MLVRNSALTGLVLLCTLAGSARAQDFEIGTTIFRGDPNGSREAGTLKQMAAPTLVPKSREEITVQAGGSVRIGKGFVPVGHQVSITAADAGDGAIVVAATFEYSQAVGPAGAQQVTGMRTQTTATVQSGGGRVRLDLGTDPKDRHWVEITVRKAE